MILNSKILANTALIVLPTIFYLFVRWINPGFEDKLWPAALLSMLVYLIVISMGFFQLLSKILQSGSHTKSYYNLGLLNLFFGVAGFIIYLKYREPLDGFFTIIPLIIAVLLILKIRE